MSTPAERAHQANVARVVKMKAQGQSAETILEMEPGLADAVQDIFSESRHDITETAQSSDLKAEMALLIARQGAKYGGGSGSAFSPIPVGEEIAA